MSRGRQRFTVMVVPHSEETVFSVQVPRAVFQAGAVFLVTLMAMVLTMFYTYDHARDEIDDISFLREQNRRQHDEINAFAYATQQLLDKIEEVDRLADAISIQVGWCDEPLSFRERALAAGNAGRSCYAARSGRIADRAASNITFLQQVIPAQTESLDALREQVEEHMHRLAATPTIWPSWGRLTSGFGLRRDPFNSYLTRFHYGVDIANRYATPIVATADGTVTFAGYRSGWGNLVIVNHGYGFSTYYAHLSSFALPQGAPVSRGQAIGYMGSTGRSTGVHLHYEVHVNGVAVNPLPYMQ